MSAHLIIVIILDTDIYNPCKSSSILRRNALITIDYKVKVTRVPLCVLYGSRVYAPQITKNAPFGN